MTDQQSLIDFIAKFESRLESEVAACKLLHKRYRDSPSSAELQMVTALLHTYRVYKKEAIGEPEDTTS